MENVKINAMDNQAGPDALGIFGSRGTKSVGTGMLYAALDAKRKLLQGVMFRLNQAPPTGKSAGIRSVDELDIVDGTVFRKSDPNNADFRMTVQQAAASGVVIVDDQPRPASGTIVGESRDFACIMLDSAGSSLAQSTFSTPLFTVTLPTTARHLLAEYPVETLEEGDSIFWTGIPCNGQFHRCCENVVCFKAQVRCVYIQKATDHHPGPREQDNGHCHFSDHQERG